MYILVACPGDRQRSGLVSLFLHLVDIPVCLQVAGVTYADIGTDAFYLLGIPQGECVVVAIGEDDGIRLAGFQIVGTEIAADIAA